MELLDLPPQSRTALPMNFALVAAVRQYYSLNSGRLSAERNSRLIDDQKLMDALVKKGLTQHTVGELFGVSGATVSRKVRAKAIASA
ncbi:MAG: hypothetical protein WA215_11890 [Candidatus Cybelea sp.]